MAGLNAETLWKLPRVGSPVPFKDGSAVIVPVSVADTERNESTTRLWLLQDGERHALTGEGASASLPRLSPDGTRLAFLRKAPKDDRLKGPEKPQVWIMPLSGGEAVRVTDMPLGVSDLRWMPDGGGLVIASALYADHWGLDETAKEAKRRADSKVKAHSTEQRFYRFWDRWVCEDPWTHFFRVDLTSREVTDLTPGMTRFIALMDNPGSWDIAPDGREIAFTANRTLPPYNQLISGVFTVPIAGGEPRLLTEWSTSNAMRPRYTPDGTHLVFGVQEDEAFYADRVRVVYMDRESGERRMPAEDWDRSPSDWEFGSSGDLLLLAEDRGATGLYRMSAEGGEPLQVARGGTFSGLEVAGGRVFSTLQSAEAPAEPVSISPDGEIEQLGSFCADVLSGVELGTWHELYFEGAEGAQVQMGVVMPPGVTEPKGLPLVHLIHGGPHGSFGDAWHWRWCAQVFAARGWLVSMVNFHGSTGWGQEFAKCIMGEWGKRPYADVMAATDHLVARGWADPERMAAAGGSYGGYLVTWIAANTDRFKCLVNHAGVSDLQAQYARDVTSNREKSIGGEPWGDQEGLDRFNPMRHSKGFSSPMLVIHGEQDFRVPYTQGLQTYNAYKIQGLDARLVVYPDENHWILKPQNSLHWYGEVLGWIDRWLKE
jgi:dipeptidyl aminopeptidase/acylaminoacyl peptidase